MLEINFMDLKYSNYAKAEYVQNAMALGVFVGPALDL